MNVMEQAKKRYDEVEIPKELEGRIKMEIRKADRKRRKRRFMSGGVWAAASAAALVVVFTAALNTNTAFAKYAGNLPVVGGIAKVLTFRSYETDADDFKISVEIPSVEMVSGDFKGLEKSVNEEILRLCQEYADEAKVRAEEYRQAFLDTGGTAAEWAAHDVRIKVWYEVKSQTDRYLSLAVMGNESWTNAYSETKYYNFDLSQGKMASLKDLLGEDYKKIADESIRQQMKEKRQKGGAVYWDDFNGVDESTAFYINKGGNPVVVFDQYEIAPGSEGRPEFEIAAGEQKPAGGYEDNFSVPAEDAAAFAKQVKEAVAGRDLEKLAKLSAFPMYIGLEGGKTVESKEQFAALGADAVFTEGLMKSVAAADENSLSASKAGFVLSDGGSANVIFGVRDGKLAVGGINY